jgi:hypothetical protein
MLSRRSATSRGRTWTPAIYLSAGWTKIETTKELNAPDDCLKIESPPSERHLKR